MSKVLDHGSVTLIEAWGSDERIIEAARMSTGKGFRGWGPRSEACPRCSGVGLTQPTPTCARCSGTGVLTSQGDERLLRYLWEHQHATPFEMAGFVVEVEAPLFVIREWQRHRTQSFNELSARYTEMPDVDYLPSVARIREGSRPSANKQASGAHEMSDYAAELAASALSEAYADAQRAYRKLLDLGVPRELARCIVPVGRYSRMRASANLRNWLAFLRLRMADDAQWEIRQYAQAIGRIVADRYPRTWELFEASR
jgi:thymidylate synthase (FAD)